MTQGMKPGVIGRFFAEEWQDCLNNRGAFYTPIPTSNSTLDELYSTQATLNALIEEWTNQLYSNTASEAIANTQAILGKLKERLSVVEDYIELKVAAGSTTQTAIDPIDTGINADDAGEKKDYTMLLIIGAGIGALLLLKKKGSKKVTGNDQQKFLLPLLLGGAVVYYFANKKYGEATLQQATIADQPAITTTDQLIKPYDDPAADIPLGGGGTVYIDDTEKIYNETLNYV
jgi:hypothetical protein